MEKTIFPSVEREKKSCEMQGFFFSLLILSPSEVVFIKKMIYGRKNGLRRNSTGLNFFSGTGSQGLSKILFKRKH